MFEPVIAIRRAPEGPRSLYVHIRIDQGVYQGTNRSDGLLIHVFIISLRACRTTYHCISLALRQP